METKHYIKKEYPNISSLPLVGEDNIFYETTNDGNIYRWDNFNTSYSQVGSISEVATDGVTITGTGTIDDPLVAVPSSQFQYEIGDYVASEGGVIFHRYLTDGTTQNYIVVDLQDLGTDVWSNINNVLTFGATSLWRGAANQAVITLQPGAISGAAFLCRDSVNGGLTDWYLPAIQELNKLWNNMLEVSRGLEIASGNQLLFNNYWSSTELDSNLARVFYFGDGYASSGDKDNEAYVRAVRQFSI
jgi:hypothetical protein